MTGLPAPVRYSAYSSPFLQSWCFFFSFVFASLSLLVADIMQVQPLAHASRGSALGAEPTLSVFLTNCCILQVSVLQLGKVQGWIFWVGVSIQICLREGGHWLQSSLLEWKKMPALSEEEYLVSWSVARCIHISGSVNRLGLRLFDICTTT